MGDCVLRRVVAAGVVTIRGIATVASVITGAVMVHSSCCHFQGHLHGGTVLASAWGRAIGALQLLSLSGACDAGALHCSWCHYHWCIAAAATMGNVSCSIFVEKSRRYPSILTSPTTPNPCTLLYPCQKIP
eukprot:5536193-Lingulodinium_polyedra.AAC.2